MNKAPKSKPVFIPEFSSPGGQFSKIGRHHWSVSRLIDLTKGLEVIEIPIMALNIYYKYEALTLRDMVMHMKAVNNADLKYPIILDEDGEVMDGRHRIMKALLLGKTTIKVVRFDQNPEPCRVTEE